MFGHVEHETMQLDVIVIVHISNCSGFDVVAAWCH